MDSAPGQGVKASRGLSISPHRRGWHPQCGRPGAVRAEGRRTVGRSDQAPDHVSWLGVTMVDYYRPCHSAASRPSMTSRVFAGRAPCARQISAAQGVRRVSAAAVRSTPRVVAAMTIRSSRGTRRRPAVPSPRHFRDCPIRVGWRWSADRCLSVRQISVMQILNTSGLERIQSN